MKFNNNYTLKYATIIDKLLYLHQGRYFLVITFDENVALLMMNNCENFASNDSMVMTNINIFGTAEL